LKNPLAKIQGIVDRLLSSKSDQEKDYIKEDLISIRRTSDELRQYITSLLQLTRVEARNIKLNKEVCDINEIIQSAIDRLRPLSDGKNLKILFEQDTLFSMEIDRTLISEVVINLIENAIKYSDFGTSIVVRTKEVDNQVRVEVEDQAGGIDEDLIPKIFDKFFRGNDDKTLKATGTGLGLYLVKYFIELHGGTVFIKSQKGIGSNIGFTLPLEPSEEDTYAAEFTRAHR
jgi:signal transduction histidine kinase